MERCLIFLSSLTSQFRSFFHWIVFNLFILLRDSENDLFLSGWGLRGQQSGNMPFPSCLLLVLKRVFVQSQSCENLFHLQQHFHKKGSHKNSFENRSRRKPRQWPICRVLHRDMLNQSAL